MKFLSGFQLKLMDFGEKKKKSQTKVNEHLLTCKTNYLRLDLELYTTDLRFRT